MKQHKQKMASSLDLGYVIVGDNIYYGCMVSYEFM